MPTFGIVGSGRIAADMAKAFKYASKENELLAVAARSFDRAKAFADEHGIPKAYGSYEELLKDDKVSIVYISTINSQHKKCVIDALNAGKNVFCEKPVAVNRREWDAMKDAARKNGKFLMEGLWTAFLPTYAKLFEEIQKGDLGELKSLTANFCYSEPSADSALDQAGGTLMSIGYYLPAVATLLFSSRPTRIAASGVVPNGSSDTSVSISLEYGGSSVAQLTSASQFQTDCPLYLTGTKGVRVIPEMFWCATKINASPNSPEFTFHLPDIKTNYPRTIGFFYEINHVGQCVEKGLKESPVVSWETTDTIVGICDETRRQIGLVYPMDNE